MKSPACDPTRIAKAARAAAAIGLIGAAAITATATAAPVAALDGSPANAGDGRSFAGGLHHATWSAADFDVAAGSPGEVAPARTVAPISPWFAAIALASPIVPTAPAADDPMPRHGSDAHAPSSVPEPTGYALLGLLLLALGVWTMRGRRPHR